MVTKTDANKGTSSPKPTGRAPTTEEREADQTVAGFDVDQRRAFEDWKREEERNRPAWKNPTKEELEVEYLEYLKDKKRKGKGGSLSMKSSDCADVDPCGKAKPQIDMEMLAEKVFQRLIFEARIERERIGW